MAQQFLSLLEQVRCLLSDAPQEEIIKLEDMVSSQLGNQRFIPSEGPQTRAYFSEADELFYGGQAGGGKTALLIGLSITEHRNSLVLRRTNKEASKLVAEFSDMLGSTDGWSGQKGIWNLGNGRTVDIGGCQYEDDKQKFKGIPHDLKGFDEISDFSESQYRFITTWNRSKHPGQRCRIVATGNPPTRPEGMWVIKYWGAWLDPKHPNPAKDGELRWYTTLDGKDTEVENGRPFIILPDGELEYNFNPEDYKPDQIIQPVSRTFIRARLSDNPFLVNTGYSARLDSLPSELRLAYRDGRFDVGLEDDPWQLIPTSWVIQAQQAWTPNPPPSVPMCAMGVDVAQGGKDRSVIYRRHDGWYNKAVVFAGKDTPDGKSLAGQVMSYRTDNARVIVDVGGGWGADCHGHLKENQIDSVPYMGVKTTTERSLCRQFTFANVRTMAYWRFREALDPTQQGGSKVQLPDDPELLADLCALCFRVGNGGVIYLSDREGKKENKEQLTKRLGRSPDKGDAAVMAWHDGAKQLTHGGQWRENARNGNRPQVKIGYQMRRKKRR